MALTFQMRPASVPEGRQTIAQRFNAGYKRSNVMSPVGTTEKMVLPSLMGLIPCRTITPALKRWAIFFHPYGINSSNPVGIGRQWLILLPLTICVLLTGCASPRTRGSACCSRQGNSTGSQASGGSISELNATWETDSGQKVRLADLNGEIRVISMFYSTCEGVCVRTKQDMQRIEAALSPAARERVGFLLVTLDPARDTCAALRSYRRVEGLSPSRWTLLRGQSEATEKLAALLGVGARWDSTGRFIHSSQIVLLDDSGRILNRYDGLSANLEEIASELEAASAEFRSKIIF
ncbi:MAG: hypothetical protein C5B50_27525 [Verrucomicrobia bacterium]|nr:MAG: hypothetical protein C5B50_27525 [Verrucomicrobiota bacterium]